MVPKNASRMRNFVTSAMTAGMAGMNSIVEITLAAISMTQASAAGYKPKMTRWTGHDTKEAHHLSLQVYVNPSSQSLFWFILVRCKGSLRFTNQVQYLN